MTAPPLATRRLGATGESVTVLGLGGAPLSEFSFDQGVATVRHGVEAGLTYFDTSPLYGQGLSQAIYGTALPGGDDDDRQGYLFATKLGHFREPRLYRSADALWAQLHENLRLLRRRRVDLLQVHEADFRAWWADGGSGGRVRDDEDYDFAAAPVVEVLREARRQGLCRYVGISGNTAANMARVLNAVDVDTCLIAFSYDLVWRGARRHVLPAARARGTAVILGAVFQYGRFTRVRRDWLEAPPEWMTDAVRERFARLYDLQAESGLSMVELTVRFLLADEEPATMLIGAASPAQLEESLAAARRGPLAADLQAQVEALGLEDA